MKDKYEKYVGKIIIVKKKNTRGYEADLVGRVCGITDYSLLFEKVTHVYNRDEKGLIAASRIKVAEMGYFTHLDLVQEKDSILKQNIKRIKIL